MEPVDLSLFHRSPVELAPRLLGLVVVHDDVALRITETEAYHGSVDPGSHAYRGRTERNSALFGPPGTVYAYINYGIHRALNLVCGEDGEAAGVLVRSGEIIAGHETARRRRGGDTREIADRMLARGPGNLAKALGIDLHLGGTPVVGPEAQVRVMRPVGHVEGGHEVGPRVGVSGVGGTHEYPWRFWVPGDPTVSAYRPGGVRRRRTAKQG